MSPDQIVSRLKSITNETAFCSAVVSIVNQLEQSQGYDLSREYQRFMLYTQHDVTVRMAGLLRHLNMTYKPVMGSRDTKINAAGFMSKVNYPAEMELHHLLLGTSHVYGIYMTVYNNKTTGKSGIHAVWGGYLDGHVSPLSPKGSMYKRVTSATEAKLIFDEYTKLINHQSLVPKLPKESKVISDREKNYLEIWTR